MKTVRAINTSRSSIRPKKLGSRQYQNARSSKDGAGSLVDPSGDLDDLSEESGSAVANSQTESSVQGKRLSFCPIRKMRILNEVHSTLYWYHQANSNPNPNALTLNPY